MVTSKESKRKWYTKNKDYALSYQREYYLKHKEEIKRKANNRYRIKCGLPIN